MDYTILPLPEHQREEIHRILSDATKRAGDIDSESILRSLQELATEDTDPPKLFFGHCDPAVRSPPSIHPTLKPL